MTTETRRVVRFGLVGVIATTVHLLVLAGLLHFTALSVLAANTLAFGTSFAVSFAGHYIWTFKAPGRPLRSLARSLLSSIAVFIINSAALQALTNIIGLAPMHAGVIATLAVPVISYQLNRLWAFSNRA